MADLETCSRCTTEVPDSTLVETDEGRLCPDCNDEWEDAVSYRDLDFDAEVLLMASRANPDLAFFPGED